ncbi:MAG: hypothetical protein LBQ77_03800 [Treponema sp.]|jgi:hypothetical protein|nr:hypothetical protein [Treponema sp.]
MAESIPRSFAEFRVWVTNFNTVVQAQKDTLGLPAEACTKLNTLFTAYILKDDRAESGDATSVIRRERREANSELTAFVRLFINKYINFNDAIGVPQRLELRLHVHDTKPTPVLPPSAQATAEIRFPGIHLIELRVEKINSDIADSDRTNYGLRIYYGIMPNLGSSAPSGGGAARELTAPPQSGDELPHSVFTRKKTHRFDFPQEDRGKKVYFCLRYENSKGEAGPWGPILDAIIP